MKAATNKFCFLLFFFFRTLEKKHVGIAFYFIFFYNFVSKAKFAFVPPIIFCQIFM